jgi:hypothetical protein
LPQSLLLLAELRNDSAKDQPVLRPLADQPLVPNMLSIRGPSGPVQYAAYAAPSYVLSDAAFSVLRPGQVIRDQIELPISSDVAVYKGMNLAGEYSFTLKYGVFEAQYKSIAARLFPEGKPQLWTGELSSKELKVTRSQE